VLKPPLKATGLLRPAIKVYQKKQDESRGKKKDFKKRSKNRALEEEEKQRPRRRR